ncbi:MAG: accessory gene regulator B family protein [Lachnospiraceae bacterium]|jgi:accessory gene regulator B|nr:accessory gene regulator B family protein [Lachnospiraceae bacterium]
MLSRLAACLVDRQVMDGIIAKEDQGLYTYGYEVLFLQLVNILLAVAVAAVFDSWAVMAVFLVTFVPLRCFCGGFHAKNGWRCACVSVAVEAGVCALMRQVHVHHSEEVEILMLILSGALIYTLAPVEDRNKPLEEEEFDRFGRVAFGIWFVLTVFWCVLYFVSDYLGFVVALAQSIVALMMVAGYVKNAVRA